MLYITIEFLGIYRDTWQLREIELKVQREITEKRQELLAKEESLRFADFLNIRYDHLSELAEIGTWRADLLHRDLKGTSEVQVIECRCFRTPVFWKIAKIWFLCLLCHRYPSSSKRYSALG